MRTGLLIDKGRKTPEISPVGETAAQQNASFIGWYRSREMTDAMHGDAPEKHRDYGDGMDRDIRHASAGLRVGVSARGGSTARVPFDLSGERFVLEVPLREGQPAGYAKITDRHGRILYRVLREGGTVRALVDEFADFYLGLYPTEDQPADTDAEAQIRTMNEEDGWSLAYPDEDGSPNPRVRMGVRVAGV